MSNIGIVGHEAAKFTSRQQDEVKTLIRELLAPPDAVLVSGHCHLGGVDIWAEEIAKEMGRYDSTLIYMPAKRGWEGGYKQRNMLIANSSNIVHVIVTKEYPEDYRGMRFDHCYHCFTTEHIKSGGCWTGKQAKRSGIPAVWHVL